MVFLWSTRQGAEAGQLVVGGSDGGVRGGGARRVGHLPGHQRRARLQP